MAKTVGLPIGLGACLLLDGAVRQRGVITPEAKEVYSVLLPALEAQGLKMVNGSGWSRMQG